MSGTTGVFQPAGPTLGLSVGAASHAGVAIAVSSNDLATLVACLNTGATAVAIKFTAAGTAAVLPGDGTAGDFVLPPLMVFPLVLPLPGQQLSSSGASPCQVTAIGSGAGPSLVYVTPVTKLF